MEYFGDVSGHFKGLLTGDCDVVVVGVISGGRMDCTRCAKKAVKQIDDIPEAKWHGLTDVQKRRMYDCFADQDRLEFGYARFTEEMLQTMNNYHYLYQDISFPPDWDLVLTGYAYGEILYDMGAQQTRHPVFEFDRVASKPQTIAVKEHTEEYVPDVNVFSDGSRQNPGIQAADCVAGGFAEDVKNGTEWRDALDDGDVTQASYSSLAKLETDLSNL